MNSVSQPAHPSNVPPTHGINILPFAAMAGGWLAPLIMFWLYVWGPMRPFDYPAGDLMPAPAFWLLMVGSIALWWLLPPGYFRIRSFEQSGRLYELMGVKLFRLFVPDGDLANRWERRSNPDYRIIRGPQSARVFLTRTEKSERGHLVLLLIGVVSAVHALLIGWAGWAVYLTLGNIIVNVYPILLQRYTRGRLRSAARGAV